MKTKNLLNNLLILVFLFISSNIQTIVQDEYFFIDIALTSAHNRIFTDSNIFNEPLSHLHNWDEALSRLGKFVNTNSHNNKELLDFFNKLESDSAQLINTIKIAYNSEFYKKDPKSINAKNASIILKPLELTKQNLIQIQKKLDNLSFSSGIFKWFKEKYNESNIKAQKEVRDLLVKLALTLELTINKVLKDASKKILNQ